MASPSTETAAPRLPAPSETAETAWIAATMNPALLSEFATLAIAIVEGRKLASEAIQQAFCRGVDTGIRIANETRMNCVSGH